MGKFLSIMLEYKIILTTSTINVGDEIREERFEWDSSR